MVHVMIAPVTDRRPPDLLDQVEHRLSGVVTDGVAQQAAEEPDVLPQREILIDADVLLGPAPCHAIGPR